MRILLTGSPDDMKRIELAGQLDNWCRDNLNWLAKTYGEENIVSAVLHLDESTPHIHVETRTVESRTAKSAAQLGWYDPNIPLDKPIPPQSMGECRSK